MVVVGIFCISFLVLGDSFNGKVSRRYLLVFGEVMLSFGCVRLVGLRVLVIFFFLEGEVWRGYVEGV